MVVNSEYITKNNIFYYRINTTRKPPDTTVLLKLSHDKCTFVTMHEKLFSMHNLMAQIRRSLVLT